MYGETTIFQVTVLVGIGVLISFAPMQQEGGAQSGHPLLGGARGEVRAVAANDLRLSYV